MYKQETIRPYNNNGDKTKQVAKMFDTIASSYDILNHRLSWNIDKSWRREAIKRLQTYHPQNILDVATGTGDFAMMSAEILYPRSIIGVDISEKMLDIGRDKVEKAGLGDIITFKQDDCTNLSFRDDSFDAVTAAFGIRNFSNLDRGLHEMCRVLKKGGHICIVELTSPVSFPMKQLFKIYSHSFLPIYGRLISKDKSAYNYLTATIEAFPQGEMMMDILKKAGFKDTCFRRFTFGVCTMYFASK